MSYASAENLGNYDSINFPLSGEAARSFSFIMPNYDVFLYATTEANKYFVQYSGTTKTSWNMPNEEYTYDTSWDLVANTYAKTWYTFSGWNRQPNWGGTGYADWATWVVYNWTAVESGVVPIYAQWNANKYKIEYDLNKGTGTSVPYYGASHPTGVTYDTQFTVNNPGRTWYTFSGWYITGMDSELHKVGWKDSTGTTASGVTWTAFNNLNATSGATVYFAARWTPDKVWYTVKHYLQDLSGAYSILSGTDNLTGTADTSVTPATGTYIWFTPNADTPYSGNIDPDGGKVFTYHYDRNSYNLTITAGRGIASVKWTGTVNTTGGSANANSSTSISFKYDEPVTLGFVLKDWYENGTWSWYEDEDATFNMPAFSTGKTAYATPKTYNITYDTKEGSVSAPNPTSYTVESSGITLNNPSRIHSEFAWWTGWVIGGTQLAGPTMTVTIPTWSTWNRSYTATWTCLSWYHLNDAQTICMPNSDTEYHVEHRFQTLTWWSDYNLIRTTTQTWETEQNTDAKTIDHVWFTVQSIDNKPITWDGSTVVKIRYDRLSYSWTITKVTGITGADADGQYSDWPYKYDDTVTLSADEEPGYTFTYWTVTDASGHAVTVTNSGSIDGATFKMPASSVTITPHVETNVYNITMILHNGTWTYPATYTVESATFSLDTPTRDTGSVFVWWSWTELAWTQPTVTITKWSVWNRTYEAIWSCRAWYHAVGDSCVANNYNVVVNPDDGEHPSADPVVFTYDEWKKVDEPEQSWYDFVWWEITWMSGWVEHYIGTITVTDSGTTYTWEVGSGFMNLTTVESGTVTFKALWEARNDTPYKVYHYYQNTGDDQYVLSGTAVEYSWTTDKPVDLNSVMENTFGFHNHAGSWTDWAYTWWSASGPNWTAKTVITIDKHGDTVIYFYYDRNVRNVYLSGDSHVTGLSGSGAYKYGQDVTVTATIQSWYHFKAWVKKNSKAELGIQ